jgi:hypothetical protein
VEGDITAIDIEPDIKTLQGIVGGYIEAVPVVRHHAHLYVNEDGLRLNLPYNRLASCLVGRPIVGDAIVLGSQDAPDEAEPTTLLAELGLA